MERIWKRVCDKLNAGELPVRLMLFNRMSLAGALACAISIFSYLWVGMSWGAILANLVCLIILVHCSYLANYKDKLEQASVVAALVIGMALFPLISISSGGIHSGMPIWFVMSVYVTFQLIKGLYVYVSLCMRAKSLQFIYALLDHKSLLFYFFVSLLPMAIARTVNSTNRT